MKNSKGKPSHQFFMEVALQEAKLAAEENEVPIGAIIVKNHQIIARAHNSNRQFFDPSAHAEILAIRRACQILNSHRLDDCQIYITIEPCLMCLTAISLARITEVYYGADDKKFGAVSSGNSCFDFINKESSAVKPKIKHQTSLSQVKNFNSYPKIQVISGLVADQSLSIMKSFFKNLRQKESQKKIGNPTNFKNPKN